MSWWLLESVDSEGWFQILIKIKVFSNNMKTKQHPIITECKPARNCTRVSFKPDLSIFGMEILEDDIVALMKKRVVDVSGCLGESYFRITDFTKLNRYVLCKVYKKETRNSEREESELRGGLKRVSLGILFTG